MLPSFFWKLLILALPLAFTLLGCGVTNQDFKQEIQDDIRGTKEQMRRGEASFEKREYFGLTSDKSEEWNSTDWSMWMDTYGGGR